MGTQSPPSFLCFILAIITVVFAVITLGLDGYLNDAGACFGNSNYVCAATGIGITAGILGLILGILAILWLLISELWDVGILRFVIVFGMFLVGLLAFISGVLNAVAADAGNSNSFFGSRFAAAAAFSFFLMLTSLLTGVFAWRAGGGGTAAA